MSTQPDNPPAFPCAAENGHQSGMTLRDWFAGQALANPDLSTRTDSDALTAEQRTAVRAYRYADAMLAERAKKDTP
jgi:hypothetical protein